MLRADNLKDRVKRKKPPVILPSKINTVNVLARLLSIIFHAMLPF